MDIWIRYAAFDISTFEVVTYWSRDYVTISFMWIFELTNDICITYCDIYLPRSRLFSLFRHLPWLWISELPKKTFDLLLWTFDLENLYSCFSLNFEKAYPIVFQMQMDIWISYAAFEVVTYWSRDYVTIPFMWIFELTNDICITYCDIYLPRSCLFSLFGHLIRLWISELPKKYLTYYCGHFIWKTYIIYF